MPSGIKLQVRGELLEGYQPARQVMAQPNGSGSGGCSQSIPNLGQLLFKALLMNWPA
ncbi:hypothetical protein [Rhizobium lentis]|uniref:hypothetical protein n=1 Tax=Rhizobium lentis TaxID=1138194 RepID=UPI001C8366AE|nr:hypothetical protein [Rhizobium lentis]MBX4989373.1 hypothetical protein [Rhizobium lentis]